MMIEFNHTKDSRTAMIIAIVFHAIIFLAMILFMSFEYPDPPLGDLSVELALPDYGDTDMAGGDTESDAPAEEVNDVVDNEVSEQIEVQPTPAPDPVISEESSDVSTPQSEEVTESEPAEEPQEVNEELNNLFGKLNSNSGGDSDGENEGVGNEGTENGKIEGTGVFDGGSFDLGGRGMPGKPKFTEKPTEEGMVVIDIYVDRNGNVIDTKRNYKESRTPSDYLFRLADKAAKTAKFQVKQDAPPNQKGSITFYFKLE